MKLTDMKLPKVKIEEVSAAPTLGSNVGRDQYPWGLRITLETDSLKKLGIDVSDFTVGEDVPLTAICEVTELSQRESVDGGSNDRMELQIKRMSIGQQGKETTIEDAIEEAKQGRRRK